MRSVRWLMVFLVGACWASAVPIVHAHTSSGEPVPYASFVSCYVKTKNKYVQGNTIDVKVVCLNKTDKEIVIRATQVWGIGIVYGHDRIVGRNGSYWGPATGCYDDFALGRTCFGPAGVYAGELVVDSAYLKDNGYTIRLPARSTTQFATAHINKIGSTFFELPPGEYIIEMGLHRVETSGGVFKDIFMSTPVKIIPKQ